MISMLNIVVNVSIDILYLVLCDLRIQQAVDSTNDYQQPVVVQVDLNILTLCCESVSIIVKFIIENAPRKW